MGHTRRQELYWTFLHISIVIMWPFTSTAPPDSSTKLDADLRNFLEEDEYNQRLREKAAKPVPKSIPSKAEDQTHKDIVDSHGPAIPSKSLYPDGRYAHLWKTYHPTEDGAVKSSNEKLRDMKEESKQRGATIDRTAAENCALEAQAEYDCLQNGGWGKKMVMCREETRALDRCQQLQSKFLRALGYLSVPGRSYQEEEKIQMHADNLYQQMLQHEKTVRQAKEAGLPLPEFKPVLSKENVAKVLGLRAGGRGQGPDLIEEANKAGIDPTRLIEMRDKAKKKLDEKWKNLTPNERAAEEAALFSKVLEKEGMIREYSQFTAERISEKQYRKEQGKETMMDSIQDWWWKPEKK